MVLERLANRVLLFAVQAAVAGDFSVIGSSPSSSTVKAQRVASWYEVRPASRLPSGVIANFNSTSLKSPWWGSWSQFRFALTSRRWS